MPMTQGPTVLYAKLVAVEAESHGSLRLLEPGTYQFARTTNAIPINWDEFIHLARSYPLVFVNEDTSQYPIAVVGLEGSRNMFLDDAGHWEGAHQVPQYLKRHPFVLVEHQEQLVLCLDEASANLSEAVGEPLFVDGKMSATLSDRLESCGAYHQRFTETAAFCHALREHGLLVQRSADVTLLSGRTVQLGGFWIIDEEKFSRMDDGVFLEWRRKGWLNLVYLHFASMSSWTVLIDLANRLEDGRYEAYVTDRLGTSGEAANHEEDPDSWIRP